MILSPSKPRITRHICWRKAVKVKNIDLANYKLSQELWNAISHGLGALFGIVALILMMLKITRVYPSDLPPMDEVDYIVAIVSCSFYAFSIIVCMTISCVYHSLAKNNGKRVLRVIDHAMVYLLIAGSYAPFCLIAMRDYPLWGIEGANFAGYLLLAICYICIAVGVSLSSVNMFKFAVVSMVMYLVGGLSILFDPITIWNALTPSGFALCLAGGVAYVLGAALYGLGKKRSIWWHTIFHFFVLVGIVLQFCSIYFYVL